MLQQIHMAQDAYFTAMFALRSRNEMMASMYEAAIPTGEVDFESGEQAVSLDAGRARRLKGITDGLYKSVDSAIELEHAAVILLAKAGKRLLPKRQFAAVEEVTTESVGDVDGTRSHSSPRSSMALLARGAWASRSRPPPLDCHTSGRGVHANPTVTRESTTLFNIRPDPPKRRIGPDVV